MPVPKPVSGESEDDFISRCMSALDKTDPERPQEQRLAMCFNTWRQSRGEQIGDTHPASPKVWADPPDACVCRSCGYVMENPSKHCYELKCPKCGAPMYRRNRPERKEAFIGFHTR